MKVDDKRPKDQHSFDDFLIVLTEQRAIRVEQECSGSFNT